MARESSSHPHASAFGVNSAGAKATLQLLADYGGDLARLARLEDHNSALGVLFLADRTAAAAWQTESTVCDKLQWVLPSKEEMEHVHHRHPLIGAAASSLARYPPPHPVCPGAARLFAPNLTGCAPKHTS